MTPDPSPWIAVVVSVVALVISVWAAIYGASRSRRAAHEMARNANFTRIHELLVDPKAAAGRRKLFLAAQRGEFPGQGRTDWDDINYSLALYDTLGAYMQRGIVDPDLALAAWHDPLQRIAAPARAFVDHRESAFTARPWAHLLWLLREAETYRPPGA